MICQFPSLNYKSIEKLAYTSHYIHFFLDFAIFIMSLSITKNFIFFEPTFEFLAIE
jgi:hypothetical protein